MPRLSLFDGGGGDLDDGRVTQPTDQGDPPARGLSRATFFGESVSGTKPVTRPRKGIA